MSGEGAVIRRRRGFWWWLPVVLILALAAYVGLRALSCGPQPVDVTITIHNAGGSVLDALSIDQVNGPGHLIVPRLDPGATVEAAFTVDDHFGVSHLDLVDDETGRNYSLPPHRFDGSLHGTIDVEVSRAGPGERLDGRARSSTDSGADPKGWEPLRED
jgi:hypothetical protein